MERCILGENAKGIGIYYTHVMRSDGDIQLVGTVINANMTK